MSERKRFVNEHLKGDYSLSELCRRFGISRKTGYKWLARFREEGGFEGLEVELADRSRRPLTSPHATDPWVVEAIVEARKRRPSWGPRKLRAAMQRDNPKVDFPSASTFAAIFKRHGLVRPRRRRHRTPPYSAPLAHATRPNTVWCIDFKGQFPVGKRSCYPLTVTDACSRYLIACVALRSTRTEVVWRALVRIFDEFGLPDALRSDNGPPFAVRSVGGLSQLAVWWLKLGIRHERIEPGKPQQNGRHERMHLTLKQEVRPQATLAAQQRAFDEFRRYYNDERPHEALGQRVPADLYEPSRRRLPSPPSGRPFAYQSNYEVVRVSKTGVVRSSLGAFFVSTALRDEDLGLKWLTPDTAQVHLGPVLLGHVERVPNRRQVRFVPVEEVVPGSPDCHP